ncbi:hypothetical protein P170DRAFT_460827 [Aspergillus steynii IBT 23096]|uniref:Uncharacterized protein n=1 Tax=Aspergillus steynii IBT 23096 TaxID=1392250 RepID=A0A2I2GPI5_9EURO|nr:uncharacterized protein P170DRAFT_460827 [Aspergillus steynii IBT 23096]PLB54790.1 hypothetical protein P170DRAFT_460827 [Aspergillus steynii IBT 23096]
MHFTTLLLTLASLGLGVHGQGSCQTSTVNSAACGSYPNGCPGSTFLSAKGNCREQFGLVDGSNCCCDCPGDEERHHCLISFVGSIGDIYNKEPKNLIGFCQDQVHYFAGNPAELFSEADCKGVQERIVKDMNDYYDKKNPNAKYTPFGHTESVPKKGTYFTAVKPKGETGKNSDGEKYWALKIKVAIESSSAGKDINKVCPIAKGMSTSRPAQCLLEKLNVCEHAFGGVFHGSSTFGGYKPKNGVEKEPKWAHGQG